MQEKIDNLIGELMKRFEDVKSLQELNDLKVMYQGKKGIITELNAGIKEISNEEKKIWVMISQFIWFSGFAGSFSKFLFVRTFELNNNSFKFLNNKGVNNLSFLSL